VVDVDFPMTRLEAKCAEGSSSAVSALSNQLQTQLGHKKQQKELYSAADQILPRRK
jgi:hypothetical protein